MRRHLTVQVPIKGLVLADLQAQGLYTRPIEHRKSAVEKPIMWDTISDAPMATEFACSRFLVPHLAQRGWALFADCDVLALANIARLFEYAETQPHKAILCVHHDYRPTTAVKMDNQIQSSYNRKLWSSVCLYNVDHEANKELTLDYINSVPGRDLHAFKWIKDDDLIGEIGQEWNWISGHSPASIDPKLVHFSEGGPWFPGYENVAFAPEWNSELQRWAA